MKKRKILACIVLVLFGGSVMAMNFNETLKGHEAGDKGSGSSNSQSSKADDSGSATGGAVLPDGEAYVKVNTSLNIRTGPWGQIVGWFHNNDKVKIIGRSGDWYKVSHNGQTRFIHSRYVSSSKNSNPPVASSGSTPILDVPGSGSVAAKVVAAARNLVTKYQTPRSFPYHPLTQGGSLGCAQVVTTALMAAGVNTGIQLGVLATIPKLKSLGWKEVSVPPYRAGDVITWRTYDRTGDGRMDDDTHIGIIMTSGNSAQAMSNSSSIKRPSLHSATYSPVCRVLRKA
ncbi:MAG: SH3 domain-containing protein [Candidatus Riflebacteria bacterium]|jgi:uncharacterized protein YgiM (DUF1202 family)|nr:SH3 domain-containing protein [Candidatus Riflebacteria bacterium]